LVLEDLEGFHHLPAICVSGIVVGGTSKLELTCIAQAIIPNKSQRQQQLELPKTFGPCMLDILDDWK